MYARTRMTLVESATLHGQIYHDKNFTKLKTLKEKIEIHPKSNLNSIISQNKPNS